MGHRRRIGMNTYHWYEYIPLRQPAQPPGRAALISRADPGCLRHSKTTNMIIMKQYMQKWLIVCIWPNVSRVHPISPILSARV